MQTKLLSDNLRMHKNREQIFSALQAIQLKNHLLYSNPWVLHTEDNKAQRQFQRLSTLPNIKCHWWSQRLKVTFPLPVGCLFHYTKMSACSPSKTNYSPSLMSMKQYTTSVPFSISHINKINSSRYPIPSPFHQTYTFQLKIRSYKCEGRDISGQVSRWSSFGTTWTKAHKMLPETQGKYLNIS